MTKGETMVGGETITRKVLSKKQLEEVADGMATVPPTSNAYSIFDAELKRRQTEAMVETAKAQRQAAIYILWSVMAILVAACITAGATVWQVYHTNTANELARPH